MPLEIFDRYYTRDLVSKMPECYFIFGDNVERRGKKGQAVIRGLPNALGIATKWRPSLDPDAYFCDYQLSRTKPILEADLNAVERVLKEGRVVYLPSAMIGTGLSKLVTNAPKTFAYVDDIFKRLYSRYRDEGLEAFFV